MGRNKKTGCRNPCKKSIEKMSPLKRLNSVSSETNDKRGEAKIFNSTMIEQRVMYYQQPPN